MLEPVNERSSVMTASSPLSSYAAIITSEASSAWSVKAARVESTGLTLPGPPLAARSRTSSRRPLAWASSARPLAVSSRVRPVWVFSIARLTG